MSTLNLGIVAHVDAGKTSLTERLLHAAGVIDEIGRVDDGTTQTDSLALERRRGITIRSAVVSFEVAGVTINLIDTPGHPDFIAEVERVLGVLDGAVLVVSAVEGVQAQTRTLLRVLRRLGIPMMIFVNKIDRRGARPAEVITEIAARLGIDAYPMGAVTDAGTPAAGFVRTRDRSEDHLTRALTAELALHPTFAGSAATGAGVPELITGVTTLLPVADRDHDAPLSGSVFTIQRAPNGEKLSYVAIRAGTLHTRQRLVGPRGADKVTGIEVFDHGEAVPTEALVAGRIGRVHGLRRSRIGDPVGRPGSAATHPFGPPTLESVVLPQRPADRGRLAAALEQLAEQDPLIGLRTDERRGQLAVSLYGEVQKEVLTDTLAAEYGLAVDFEATTPVCVERLVGPGAAEELLFADGNPFLAGVGLRVEPAPPGAGIDYGLEVELGSMPAAFMRAVEETVRSALRQGAYGWEIPDAVVRLTRSGYCPRQSHSHGTFDKSMSTTAGDFRYLTQLVLAAAVTRAGTQVCAPVQAIELELPADALTVVLPGLTRLGGVPMETVATGPGAYRVHGELPTASVHEFTALLPGLSHGEGVLEATFSHFAPVTTGAWPVRERTDDDPYHRVEFLRTVSQRVALRR